MIARIGLEIFVIQVLSNTYLYIKGSSDYDDCNHKLVNIIYRHTNVLHLFNYAFLLQIVETNNSFNISDCCFAYIQRVTYNHAIIFITY